VAVSARSLACRPSAAVTLIEVIPLQLFVAPGLWPGRLAGCVAIAFVLFGGFPSPSAAGPIRLSWVGAALEESSSAKKSPEAQQASYTAPSWFDAQLRISSPRPPLAALLPILSDISRLPQPQHHVAEGAPGQGWHALGVRTKAPSGGGPEAVLAREVVGISQAYGCGVSLAWDSPSQISWNSPGSASR